MATFVSTILYGRFLVKTSKETEQKGTILGTKKNIIVVDPMWSQGYHAPQVKNYITT
jgi:hypothetical protein